MSRVKGHDLHIVTVYGEVTVPVPPGIVAHRVHSDLQFRTGTVHYCTQSFSFVKPCEVDADSVWLKKVKVLTLRKTVISLM